jgi:hypothetical protein
VSFLIGSINEVVAFLRHLVAVSWAAHVVKSFLDASKNEPAIGFFRCRGCFRWSQKMVLLRLMTRLVIFAVYRQQTKQEREREGEKKSSSRRKRAKTGEIYVLPFLSASLFLDGKESNFTMSSS